MPGPPCSVCSRPDVDDVHRALDAPGASGRGVAELFNIPETTLRRHLAHRIEIAPAPRPPPSTSAGAAPGCWLPFTAWCRDRGLPVVDAAYDHGDPGAALGAHPPPEVLDVLAAAEDPAELLALARGVTASDADAVELLAAALALARSRPAEDAAA